MVMFCPFGAHLSSPTRAAKLFARAHLFGFGERSILQHGFSVFFLLAAVLVLPSPTSFAGLYDYILA